MTVCIAGKNNIAVNVCQQILERYPEVSLVSIYNKTDWGEDSWQRSFRKYCHEKNIPAVTLQDVYNIPDLIFISLEFDSIIKPEKFASKQLYNIHFSLLPEYKGMYTSALPILHGTKYSGVTFHQIDAGIDTGDIIAQEKFALSPQETARSLYLKYINKGTDLVISLLGKILRNECTATPQPAAGSTYYSKKAINYSNVQIDAQVTANQLDSQIRAYTFREYQLPQLNGRAVRKIEITTAKSNLRPGSITNITPYTHTQATIDYDVNVYYDQMDNILQCCRENDVETLKNIPLLQSYLDEQEPTHGWTPLMVAAYHHSTDVCTYLLSHGANVNARNHKGTTVLMYAKDAALATHDFKYLDLFLKHGADKHALDNAGLSLADYLHGQSLELKEYLHI